MTRSISMLSIGAFRRSIDFHPLGIIVAGWLLYKFFQALISSVSGKTIFLPISSRAEDILLYSFLGALFLQWILRLAIFFLYAGKAFHPRILDMLKFAA
jgi:hypothetical protein